jgi:membrane protein implicated in regulation of membrane protease activity
MTNDDLSTPDGIARRAVEMFMSLVRRGTALAVGTLVIVSLICIGGFMLGLAAITGGARNLWILVGGGFALLGIGAVALAIFRLWLVKRSATVLVDELRRMMTGDERSERMVIETIEATEGVEDQSAVVMSRQFFTMRDSVAGQATQFVALTYALRAMTSFPVLMLTAVTVTLCYVGLSFIFIATLMF